MPAPGTAPTLEAALRESRKEVLENLTSPTVPGTSRAWLLEAWRAQLDGEGHRHVLFRAGPGFGKTVAAAQHAFAAAADGTAVAAVFFRSGYAALEDPVTVTKRLSDQLAELVPGFGAERSRCRTEAGADTPLSVTVAGPVTVQASNVSGSVTGVHVSASSRSAAQAWHSDVGEPLQRLHAEGRLGRVLVVLDGLDETTPLVLDLLADGLTLLPPVVQVLATARPGTDLPVTDPAARSRLLVTDLDTDERLQEASGADEGLIAGWVRERLAGLADEARVAAVAERVAAVSDHNFLVAFHLSEDLLLRFGSGEELPAPDELELPTGGLAGVYDAFLVRLFESGTSEAWRQRGRPVLALLSIARDEGLTLGLLSAAARMDGIEVSDALQACAQFVRSDDGVWRIWHRSFADHLHASTAFPLRRWDWEARLGAALVDHAVATTASGVREADHRTRYAARHATTHLLEAAADPDRVVTDEASARLRTLYAAPHWLEAFVALAGPVEAASTVERSAPHAEPAACSALAEALRHDQHVLTTQERWRDGFTLGQLSLHAVRRRDAVLRDVVARWSASSDTVGLLAGWSTEQGDDTRVLARHAGGVNALVVVPTAAGPAVITAGRDGWLRVWAAADGAPLARIQVSTTAAVTALAAHDEGGAVLVAAGTGDGLVAAWRWSPAATAPVPLWSDVEPGSATISALVVVGGPGERLRLLAGDLADTVSERGLVDGVLIDRTDLRLPVRALCVVPGGATTSSPGAPSPRGPLLVATRFADTAGAAVRDLATGEGLEDLPTPAPVYAAAADLLPDGTGVVALAEAGPGVRVFSMTWEGERPQWEALEPTYLGRTRAASVGWTRAITIARFPGLPPLLVAGDDSGRIFSSELPVTGWTTWAAGHSGAVSGLVATVVDEAPLVISAGAEDGLVKAWTPESLRGSRDHVLCLATHGAATDLAPVAVGHPDGGVSFLDPSTGDVLSRTAVHDSPIWALTYADRTQVVAGGHGFLTAVEVPAAGVAGSTHRWADTAGQVTALAAGQIGEGTLVGSVTTFSEVEFRRVGGERVTALDPALNGFPLQLRLVDETHGGMLLLQLETTPQYSAMTGMPVGDRVAVYHWSGGPSGDWSPQWWLSVDTLTAWTAARAGGRSVLLFGYQDGAVTAFDLVLSDATERVTAFELWPNRSPVSAVVAGEVAGELVVAWTTADGWLFRSQGTSGDPLRVFLGVHTTALELLADGSVLVAGPGGVVALRTTDEGPPG